jgi:hypothetical protein
VGAADKVIGTLRNDSVIDQWSKQVNFQFLARRRHGASGGVQ